LNETFLQRSFYQIKIFAMFMPMLELLSSVAVGLIIWYGGGQIIQEKMTLGMLVAFLSYMRLFFQPLRDLSQKYSIVQSSLASAERIFQLMDTACDLPTAKTPKLLTTTRGKIEFTNVTFGYEKDLPVVKELTFVAEAGATVALVGATGSGKTTIINLLERFYDPEQGEILLDGINLKELDIHALRRQIGLVMQDVYIFPATFKENIILDKTISDQRLREIIEAAQLSRFVAALPEGLATRIGEGGQDLSAGQRQLLAMARVLTLDPRILVLDEATSSIDTETEILIERALAATMANRTSIIIAHRLSTIRRADRIMVMEQGKIVEEGDHKALMAGNGIYHRLQTMQNELL
jgi:ATP-binding cassette subfamily B protein